MEVTNKQKLVRTLINQKHNIIVRDKWGANSPRTKNLVVDWDHDSIVIHHSGNSGEKDPTEIEKIHMTEHGWDDVGYHYLIHPDGKIYEGRKIYYKGSHVSRKNTGKVGILLLGDYNEQWWDFDDTLQESHIAAANSLIKTLKVHFPTLKYLGGHKEFLPNGGYTCPGNLIMDVLEKMRNKHALSKP